VSRDPVAELGDLAEGLALAVSDSARVGRGIRESWWDVRGRETADRVDLAARELGRQAAEVADLARAVADLLAPDRLPGAHLPGIGGRRAEETRGVRLPLLGEADEGRS